MGLLEPAQVLPHAVAAVEHDRRDRDVEVVDQHVMVAPILLGRGSRLWDDLRGLEITHDVTSEVADSGTIHVTFSRAAA